MSKGVPVNMVEKAALQFVYHLNHAPKAHVQQAKKELEDRMADLSRDQGYRTTCRLVLTCLRKQLMRY